MRQWTSDLSKLLRVNLLRVMEARTGRKRKANTPDVLVVHAGKPKAKKRKSVELKNAQELPIEEKHDNDGQHNNDGINNGLQPKSILALGGTLQDCCLLFLKRKQTVAIKGKVDVKPLVGSVSIVGSIINPGQSFYKLFSPSSSSLLTIRDCGNTKKDKKSELLSVKELLQSQDKEIIKLGTLRAQKASSVLMMKRLETVETTFLCRYKPYSELFGTDAGKITSQESSLDSTKTLLHVETSPLGFTLCDADLDRVPMFHEPDEWKEVIKGIERRDQGLQSPSVLICGGKEVGKSSFARYMMNALLNSSPEVYYMECDVGQTEFTPPAILSISRVTAPLLGPPFTHLKWPERCYFFGDVTPKDTPNLYIQSIEDMQRFYQENCMDAPLIINTQGWVKGMGIPLLVDIIRITKPSHVIQISSSTQPSRNLPTITNEFLDHNLGWISPLPGHDAMPQGNGPDRRAALGDLVTKLRNKDDSIDEEDPKKLLTSCRVDNTRQPVIIQLESVSKPDGQGSGLHSADYRAMSLLSYFSQMQETLSSSKPATSTDNDSVPLSHYVPYRVPWSHVAVHVMHTEVPCDQVMFSLNASIVGLAITPQLPVLNSEDQDGSTVLKDTPMSECVGLGIVRNIDPTNKLFYILTPVPLSTLQQVNTLLKGNLEIPASLWLQEAKPGAPYVSSEFSYDLKGAGARKVRYNLLRKKYNSPGKPTM